MPAPARDHGRLVIGSRGSPLALAQTRMVREAIVASNPGLDVDVEIIRTTGDRQQEWASPPAGPQAGGGKGIFVKEIEEALLSGRVDLAVHSMKDLPAETSPGLRIAAVPAREDPRDVLVARDGLRLRTLPEGARVGTGSPRRIAQLRNARRDLEFVPLRGNVDTRLRKVREGALDAAVLAAAGLRRLGLLEAGWEILDGAICLPAVGQGALAVQAREDDGGVLAALAALHDPATAACVEAERAFLAALGGGCQVPVAALALLEGGTIHLEGAVGDPGGARLVRVSASGPAGAPVAVGEAAAAGALARGAGEILAAVRAT